jgi:hypothetical protein
MKRGESADLVVRAEGAPANGRELIQGHESRRFSFHPQYDHALGMEKQKAFGGISLMRLHFRFVALLSCAGAVMLGGCAELPRATPEQIAPANVGDRPKHDESQNRSAITVRPGSYYVSEEVQQRRAPSPIASVSNVLYRQQRVDVYEVRDGWARISKYYNGQLDGSDGQIAAWIPADKLSDKRLPDLKQPPIAQDPRIEGIGKAGEEGLSYRDVEVLTAAAHYYLEIGRATKIEWGDADVDHPGRYYLNFGEPRNHFFEPRDIPDLEARIQKLGRQADASSR